MKKVLLVISLLLVVWCLAAQENSNTIIKGNETISVEDSVYEVKLKLSDPAENVHTEKLLINDNSQFNNPSRSTITRQGDNPSYGPWGSTITNSVFPNGHTPPFTSYLVLGEESENVGQGGINGGAGYILSGLPSGDISDYTDLDLKVYYYTTDECLWHETANNNHYTYDLYRGNGGLYHGEVGPLNDETNYVTTYDIRNTFIDAIIYGGQVQIELSSTDEIAINYVQLVYTYSPPEPADLDISNNNIPDPIPYTAGDYTLRVNNDGDETLYWNTSSIPSWASVNPSSGSVSGGSYTYVVVSFEQNNSSSSRNDNIEFYNTQNTSDDEWIYFEQEGIPDPANLDLSNNNIPDPIPYTGGVHTIRINNIGEQTLYWDTTSIPTWASVYSPSGSVNGGNYQTVNVYIDENTGTSSRNDDIKFYNTQNSSDYEWIYFEQEAPTYTVSGTVESDIHDFDKFVGVEVEIAGVASDITDSNGYFEIDNVPAGSQTISISHSGQAFTWENNQTTYNRTITVNGNETENFEGHCRANADIWIDCPSEFTTGQPFNVTVNLVNTNAVIMDVDANLDISFPDLTSGSNPFAVTNVSQNGFPAPSYVAAGDPNMWILDMSTGQWTQSPADFLLINGVRTETMYNNQTWSYTVQINPIDTEDITIHYKGNIVDSREPVSGTIGQQGIWENTITIPHVFDPPEPDILEINYSTTSIEIGEYFDLEVLSKNLGGMSDEACISVTFPELGMSNANDYVDVLTGTSGDITVTEHNPGTSIFHKDGYQFTAYDLLVEGIDSEWNNNETNTLNLRITPQSVGTFTVQIRSTMKRTGTTDEYYSDPTSGPTDQQGWWIIEETVTVNPDLIDTRFSGNEFIDKTCKYGVPTLLEANLQKYQTLFWWDLSDEPVYFEIYYNNMWHSLPEENPYCVQTNSEGIASLYYTAPISLDVGNYPIRAGYDGSDTYDPCEITATLTINRPEWLLIYYFNGYSEDPSNILEEDLECKFSHISQGIDNNEVTAVTFWDHVDDDDQDGIYIMKDEENWTNYIQNLDSFIPSDLPDITSDEFNTGDPETMNSISQWISQRFDANNFGMSIMGHGAGVVPRDNIYKNINGRGVLPDQNDTLYVDELNTGLGYVEDNIGQLGLLHFDSCLMQMIEVAYEIKDHVDYVIGSEHVAYASSIISFEDDYLSNISSNTSAQLLSENIATAYKNFVQNYNVGYTISVLQLNEIDNIITAINEFSNILYSNAHENNMDYYISRLYTQTFGSVTGYNDPNKVWTDLYNFAENIINNVDNPTIVSSAQDLLNEIDGSNFIVYEDHQNGTNYDMSGTNGFSIYFPLELLNDEDMVTFNNYRNYSQNPSNLNFVFDTGWDEFLEVFQDEEPPQCNIIFPNTESWYSGDINITAQAAEDQTIPISTEVLWVEFEYSLDQSNWINLGIDNDPTGGWTYNFPTSDLNINDNNVWVHAKAKDMAGNESTWDPCDVPFGIDNTTPEVPDITTCSHDLNTWSSDRTIQISWTCNDNGPNPPSGIDGYSWEWDQSASTIPNDNLDGTNASTTSSSLNDGDNWYFHVKAKDNAGNWGEPEHYGPFFIDGTGPNIPNVTFCSHNIESWDNDRTIYIEWTVSDPSDNEGSRSNIQSQSDLQSTESENIRLSGIDGCSWEWSESSVTEPDNTIDGDENLTTSPTLSDGNYWYFHVKALDIAGNWGNSEHHGPFYIDGTEPEEPDIINCTHNIYTWSSDETIDIEWECIDNGPSGVNGYSWEWDQISSTDPNTSINGVNTNTISMPLGDGDNWYFHVKAVDNAGNWGVAEHHGPFYIDVSPPIGAVLINNGATTTNTLIVTLYLTAYDDLTNVEQMRFSNDNLMWTEWELFSLQQDDWDLSQYGGNTNIGLKTVYVQFLDTVNNTSISYSDEIEYTMDIPYTLTEDASNITEIAAQLNGIINPNGSNTDYYFEYGLTNSYGQQTTVLSAGAGSNNLDVFQEISGLTLNTTYHFRLVGTNPGGTSYGGDITFTTPYDIYIVVNYLIPEPGSIDILENENIDFIFSGYDPNGNPLEYSWKLDGDEDGTDSTYTFETDYTYAGNYSITFDVTDNYGFDNILYYNWNIQVENVNQLPVANAGEDQEVLEEELVQLDGSGSYDLDNDDLTYLWIPPAGVVLSDPTIAEPTFDAPTIPTNEPIEYEFILVVDDGVTTILRETSNPDTVKIIIMNINHVPIADAGEDQEVLEEELVQLDGSGSYDLDNDELTYLWTPPAGIELSDPTIADPTFDAPTILTNEPIEYEFILEVDDGITIILRETSDPDTVVITVMNINQPPIANAGEDQSVEEGNIVQLDGSESNDPDLDMITYLWTAPESISLSDSTVVNPTFNTPDVSEDTDYTIYLIVNDSEFVSEIDSLIITVLWDEVGATNDLLPKITKLYGNHPNPFNPTTTIEYSVKEDSRVLIEIYNIKGQKVEMLINGFREAGYYSVVWDGKDSSNKQVASGLYLYRMKTSNYDRIRKMLLLK